MKIIPVSQISDAVVFKNIYGIFQTWDGLKKYSYLSEPRPNHGFIFIDCDHLRITDKNGVETEYKKGNILYLPKGAYYQASFPENDVSHSLLVNFDMYLDSGEELRFYEDITLLVSDASAKYTDEFYKIINAFKNVENNYLIIKAAFLSLCAVLSAHIGKRTLALSEKSVAKALIYMENHINSPLSVPELAKLCALSETVFRRHFKSAVGTSPSDYIRKLKIKKAKELLKMTEASLSDISDILGFYDLSYFCKVFASETGGSPTEYRRNYI